MNNRNYYSIQIMNKRSKYALISTYCKHPASKDKIFEE